MRLLFFEGIIKIKNDHSLQDTHFSAHFDTIRIILRHSYHKLQYVEHCHAWYHWKQLYRDLGSERLLFLYNPMGQSGGKCSLTPLFCHIFIGKSVYCDCAWYDDYFGRIYQKWKILTLVHIFAHNSKSILPQSASFSHAGTHMCTLGDTVSNNQLDKAFDLLL